MSNYIFSLNSVISSCLAQLPDFVLLGENIIMGHFFRV